MTKDKEIQAQRKLTAQEMDAVNKMKAKSKPHRDIFRMAGNGEASWAVEPVTLRDLSPQDAEDEFLAQIHAITGASCEHVGQDILVRACQALAPSSEPFEKTVERFNRIAQAMRGFEPQDQVEGQLISQLVVLHEQAMSFMGQASHMTRPEFVNTYVNAASKLFVRHHETLEALMRYRRRGEQRVHVEHVHIHEGGKAIVGTIHAGGGGYQKNEEGPHATM